MTKRITRTQKPVGITPAYENAPGKPIMRSGCNLCGLLGSHTPTCPAGMNPVPRRTPLDPL